MTDKKNIGIVTWFNSVNYGTCLQAFALNKFLVKKGYKAYIAENLNFYYGINCPLESIFAIINKLFKSKGNNNNSKNKALWDKRIEKNNNFAYTQNKIFLIKTKQEFKSLLEKTDIFLTGSDQIWNPNHLSLTFLLAFANKKHKKIAYASSIGVEHIPFFKRAIYKKYLSRFNKIGVREKTAQKELSNLLKKEVTTVLDPTFLLAKEDWSQIIEVDKCESLPTEKYIFCYFIGNNRDWESKAEKFANENGYKIYYAVSESCIIPNIGISKIDLGVNDFVNYLKNADYIITDSFHAVALSINFNKDFAVFKRFKNIDNKSQNSRVLDLLSMLKLSERLIEDNSSLDILSQSINYDETNNILSELRQFSEKFLINALEEG